MAARQQPGAPLRWQSEHYPLTGLGPATAPAGDGAAPAGPAAPAGHAAAPAGDGAATAGPIAQAPTQPGPATDQAPEQAPAPVSQAAAQATRGRTWRARLGREGRS